MLTLRTMTGCPVTQHMHNLQNWKLSTMTFRCARARTPSLGYGLCPV